MRNKYRQTLIFFLTVFLTSCRTTSTQVLTDVSTVQTTSNITPSISTTLPMATTEPPFLTSEATITEVATGVVQDQPNVREVNNMHITIGDNVLTATLAENSSADALMEALSEGPITIEMRDYGSMEKVGPLGMDLPRNDEQLTTEAGDIILYQGNALVIYYAPNSWNFTRLGKIDNITPEELKTILGAGNVTVTLSLP